MPHKKDKLKKKASIKQLTASDNELTIQHDAAEMDLVNDLNEDFFEESNRLVQLLMEGSQRELASRMKCFIDLLARLHAKYIQEYKQNKILTDQIQTVDEKLRAAFDTTATSNDMFKHLKVSLEDAWRATDASVHREAMLRDQVHMLSTKETSVIKAMQTEETNIGNSRLRDAVFRERDRLNLEVFELERRLELQRYYSQNLESMIDSYKDTIYKQVIRLKTCERDNNKWDDKFNHMKGAAMETISELEKELNTAKAALGEHDRSRYEIMEKFRECDRISALNERLLRENEIIQNNSKRMEEQNNALNKEKSLCDELVKSTNHKILACNQHINLLEQNNRSKTLQNSILTRKLNMMHRKVVDLEHTIASLKNSETNLVKRLKLSTDQLFTMTCTKDEILRSRNRLQSDLRRLNDYVAELKHQIMLERNEQQQKNTEFEKTLKKLDECHLNIEKAKKEKSNLMHENIALHEKNSNLSDELEQKAERISSLMDQMQTKHKLFLQVKKQMETIHSVKVMLSKNLELCSRDRHSLQTLNTKMGHQIHQMTSELALNEKEISHLKVRNEHMTNKIKSKITEIHTLENILNNTRIDLREMKVRAEQAQHTIDEDDKRILNMTRELEEQRKVKNLVGLQMVRRNDEVITLRDRLNIMQAAMDRGHTQYNQRLEDIRLLKLEIQNLRHSNDCLLRAAHSTTNMRNEVLRLERLLSSERQRISAFVEDMKRPCCVHRWRVLRGKDPKMYELLTKIQILLKRNLKLNNENTNLRSKYKTLEKMYETLKSQISLQADPNIHFKLCEQRSVTQKQRNKIKVLEAELSITVIDLKARETLIDGYQATLKEAHLLGKLPVELNKLLDRKTPSSSSFISTTTQTDSDYGILN